MSSAAGPTSTETGGVSNQLSSLVPTFDPALDDVLIYQKKVELVLAAWPKARLTELVTRLILGCKGSAFEKLQIHQQELLVGEEKSVHRTLSCWGDNGGEYHWKDNTKMLRGPFMKPNNVLMRQMTAILPEVMFNGVNSLHEN